MSKEIKKWDVQILLLQSTQELLGLISVFFFFFPKKDMEQIIFVFGALDGIKPMTYLNPNPFQNTAKAPTT